MVLGKSRRKFGLSILNLTDQAPPFANVEFAYDGMTHNPKGRRVSYL